MSAVLTPTLTAPVWRPSLLALVAVLLLLGSLYADTVTTMVGIWNRSETFAHAFLVPPISLWLIWRRRAELAQCTPQPMPVLLVLLAVAAAAWLMADLVLVNAVAQFAWVGMLVLTVPALLGMQVTRVILFPLLFLFFGVPFGEFMLEPMMDWTADFVVLALQMTGVPVLREGLNFVIPSGRWSVIDECSGVRYLIASFMVGTLFAYLNYRSYKRRAIFMLVSIAVPIVANWFRAYMIVMMGHLSGNTIAVGVDHLIYGWVFFGVVIFIMFIIGSRWSEPDAPVPTPSSATAAASHARSAGAALALTTLALAGVLALPHGVLWGLQRAEASAAPVQLQLPARLGADAERQGPPAQDWAPSWQNPSASDHQVFGSGTGQASVYVGYYRGQAEDSKLVSSLNGVAGLNDRRWNPLGTGTRTLAAGGQDITLRSTRILGPESLAGATRPHLFALSTYWIDGRWVAGDAAAKLANALARLRGRGDDGAVVVVYVVAADFEQAEQAAQRFAQAQLAPLGDWLQTVRDAR